MDLKDISARMKSAKDTKQEASRAKPFDPAESFRLRGKMLGVLLRDARMSADRSVEDCARVVNVEPAQMEAWEFGDSVPSLPQLELLANYLDIPVSHFWGMQTLEIHRTEQGKMQQTYILLRQHMIGALMRQARENLNLSLEQVSQETYVSEAHLTAYELGEVAIPLHELGAIAGALKQNVSYFLENESRIGEMLSNLEAWKHFHDLPENLRAFAANPVNIGFIEIALAFSQMESERLKRIAVSMLDITGY